LHRKRGLEIFFHKLHKPSPAIAKTELQAALSEAIQTDKRTAGAFLNALGPIAYKAVKKEGEFVLTPGLLKRSS
jgi:hypothetical protein